MILLHRLGHQPEPFHLNPDLITTIEAHPDCVVSLATGHRLVVMETPDEITEIVRDWRASIMRDAFGRTPV